MSQGHQANSSNITMISRVAEENFVVYNDDHDHDQKINRCLNFCSGFNQVKYRGNQKCGSSKTTAPNR